MIQNIWKSWKNNYLHTLKQRNKWVIPENNRKVNDTVVIKEDDTTPC